tara:strand:- start:924 stop:1169 length:246 start_codon:yes stop_codon:yes gene_type:complete
MQICNDSQKCINFFEKKCYALDLRIDSMYQKYNRLSGGKKRSISGKLYLKRIHRLEEKILKLFKRQDVKLERLDFLQDLKK